MALLVHLSEAITPEIEPLLGPGWAVPHLHCDGASPRPRSRPELSGGPSGGEGVPAEKTLLGSHGFFWQFAITAEATGMQA